MKIIILDNFFDYDVGYNTHSKFNYKILQYYKDVKLKSLIKNLRKKYGENIKIKIFLAKPVKYHPDGGIQTVLASDFRVDIEREEFIEIKNKVLGEVKEIMVGVFKNLRTSKIFYLEGIFLGKLLEFHFSSFLKQILGEYEVLNKILLTETYDKGIIFNYNSRFLPFFRELNKKYKNLEVFQEHLLKQVKNSSYWFFSKFIIKLIGFTIKTYPKKQKELKNTLGKKIHNILFFSFTINQFESIRQIFEYFQNEKDIGAFLYEGDYSISLKNLTKLLRFSFQIRNIWLKEPKNILIENYKIDSKKLMGLLKEYYRTEMFFNMVKIFNFLKNFKKILRVYIPSLVVLADELRAEARLCSKYCRIKRIPNIYVTHASIPIYSELIEEYDFEYITVPGELDKKYLIEKGIQSEKIFVTGRSRYDKFYRGEINRFDEIRDTYTNRVYRFEPNKFTILYLTNKVDIRASNEYDKKVLLSLKELNLLDNLIIKVHPLERTTRHKRVLEELKIKEPIIVHNLDILGLIKSSNLVLSQGTFSVTTLETMIVGTPVITLDLVNNDLFFSGTYKYFKEKDLIIVKDQNSLTESIKKLVFDKEFYNQYSKKLKQLAKGYSYYNGKKTATDNIVSLIEKIIKIN